MVCAFTLTPALEKPVKFTAPPTSGVEGVDETVRSSSFTFRLQVDELLTLQWEYLSEFGMFRESVIPDPRLVAFGAKFSTLKEFAETEVKRRFG
jgi:hypothetical protein